MVECKYYKIIALKIIYLWKKKVLKEQKQNRIY
jgi:hypothetical protein